MKDLSHLILPLLSIQFVEDLGFFTIFRLIKQVKIMPKVVIFAHKSITMIISMIQSHIYQYTLRLESGQYEYSAG